MSPTSQTYPNLLGSPIKENTYPPPSRTTAILLLTHSHINYSHKPSRNFFIFLEHRIFLNLIQFVFCCIKFLIRSRTQISKPFCYLLFCCYYSALSSITSPFFCVTRHISHL